MKLALPLLASLVVSRGGYDVAMEQKFIEKFVNGTLDDLQNNCTKIIQSSAFNSKITQRFTSKQASTDGLSSICPPVHLRSHF